MNRPLVSILMPVYNSSDFARSGGALLLPKALDSLLAQSYKNFELIILDNQSTDATPDICKSYLAKDSRIRYILDTEKRFPEGAINHLASLMQGKYCMFANDDDLWHHDYIQKMVEFLEQNPEIDMVYSNGNYINIDGSFAGRIIQSKMDTYSEKGSSLSNFSIYIQKRNVIPIIFGVFRSDALRRTLPFEPFDKLKANVDNLFMAKFFLLGQKCHYIDDVLFFYRRKSRKLGPKIPELPSLEKPLLIWLYYVRHQFYFFRKLVEMSRALDLSKVQQYYLKCMTLDSFLKHSFDLLAWIKNEYVQKGHDKVVCLKTIRFFEKVLNPLLLNVAEVGIFPDDAHNNVRFQPSVIARFLELSRRKIATFARLIEYYNSLLGESEKPELVRDLEVLLQKEISIVEKEKVQAELEIGKTPEILIKTVDERVEKSEDMPKLSVISPSMNLARFLEETIRSVVNQSFRDFEHIVIDGGSTDETLTILKCYPHIKWISEKDSGYLEAMRKGLAIARGKYVMNCAVSDGYLDKDWFQRCVDVLDTQPEVSLVWGFPQYLTEDSKLGDISYPQFHHSLPPQKYEFLSFWLETSFYLPEGNFCVRKEVFDKCLPAFDGFPEYLDVWLEFNYNFNSLGYVPYHIPVGANFGRTHENQRGQWERESGLIQRRLEAYFKKVRHYRWKLLTGMGTHVYRDGAHNSLPVQFSKRTIMHESIRTIYIKYFSKYLPVAFKTKIKRILKR